MMEIIRSALLSQFSNLLFGMSARYGGVSGLYFDLNMSFNVGDKEENVKENRRRFFSELGAAENQVAFPMQEHTSNVKICSSAQKFPHCDALITAHENIYLAISVADCSPIVLFDPLKNVIAAVHAGWRGTQQRIAEKAVQIMKDKFHSTPEDIVAFIGPSAGACCYEVGEEVAKLFPQVCIHPKKNGKFHLDVKQANVLQLLENNLQESHIEVHSDCTIHNKNYHSFRRDGKNSGRMLAIVGLKRIS